MEQKWQNKQNKHIIYCLFSGLFFFDLKAFSWALCGGVGGEKREKRLDKYEQTNESASEKQLKNNKFLK